MVTTKPKGWTDEKECWDKYWDDEAGSDYWYNPNSNQAIWTKPTDDISLSPKYEQQQPRTVSPLSSNGFSSRSNKLTLPSIGINHSHQVSPLSSNNVTLPSIGINSPRPPPLPPRYPQ